MYGLRVANAAHKLLSYPLAYSLMVLPVSIARWSLFNHKEVSSAATFFSVSIFNLSGAINVLLFLIVRPQLLLFSPPEESEEVELGPTTGSAIFPDTAKYNQSPQPAGMALVDDAEDRDGNSIALSRIDSRSRSDGIQV